LTLLRHLRLNWPNGCQADICNLTPRTMSESGHKEPYSTASPHDRCTFDCGRSREAGTRRRGRATVMPIIAGLRPNNDALRDLPPPPQYWRCSWTARRSPSRSGTWADETVRFSMSGAIRGCGVLSRESRAQAAELVVTHSKIGQSGKAKTHHVSTVALSRNTNRRAAGHSPTAPNGGSAWR
jgi:hypothetical protein